MYYGAVKGKPYKWLDVAGMCQRILPKITINRVRYFTAMVDGSRDPSAPLRQQIYLRALATTPNLSIHRGFVLTKPTWMPVETPPPNLIRVIKTEEKGSDVNLATYLLLDAFEVISTRRSWCRTIQTWRSLSASFRPSLALPSVFSIRISVEHMRSPK